MEKETKSVGRKLVCIYDMPYQVDRKMSTLKIKGRLNLIDSPKSIKI